jgi:hypothetical protein
VRDDLKRIYHHYTKLEEFKSKMWKTISGEERERLVKIAFDFTSDHNLYGEWMLKVLDAWPNSCEQNLGCVDMNRQAWIGHAAVAIAIDCPEDITRIAWHQLTQEQQDKANLKADHAISVWEKDFSKEEKCLSDIRQLTFFHLLENA